MRDILIHSSYLGQKVSQAILLAPSAFAAQVFLPPIYNPWQKKPMRRYRQRYRQYSYWNRRMVLTTTKKQSNNVLRGAPFRIVPLVLTSSLLACVVVLNKTFLWRPLHKHRGTYYNKVEWACEYFCGNRFEACVAKAGCKQLGVIFCQMNMAFNCEDCNLKCDK